MHFIITGCFKSQLSLNIQRKAPGRPSGSMSAVIGGTIHSSGYPGWPAMTMKSQEIKPELPVIQNGPPAGMQREQPDQEAGRKRLRSHRLSPLIFSKERLLTIIVIC